MKELAALPGKLDPPPHDYVMLCHDEYLDKPWCTVFDLTSVPGEPHNAGNGIGTQLTPQQRRQQQLLIRNPSGRELLERNGINRALELYPKTQNRGRQKRYAYGRAGAPQFREFSYTALSLSLRCALESSRTACCRYFIRAMTRAHGATWATFHDNSTPRTMCVSCQSGPATSDVCEEEIH